MNSVEQTKEYRKCPNCGREITNEVGYADIGEMYNRVYLKGNKLVFEQTNFDSSNEGIWFCYFCGVELPWDDWQDYFEKIQKGGKK
jgi:hypothetical protein